MKKKRGTGRARCFRKRDKWMKRLGFKTYSNYLKSDTWRRIRKEALEKRKYKCFFCDGFATEVHHLRYTRPVLMGLGKHYLGGLIIACRDCHQMISDFAKKNKIHEARAFQLYNEMKKKVQ